MKIKPKDGTGLVLVAAAAAVLYMVVKKTAPAGAPGVNPAISLPGQNNASYLSQFIAAMSPQPTSQQIGPYTASASNFGLAGFNFGNNTIFGLPATTANLTSPQALADDSNYVQQGPAVLFGL